MLKTKLGSDNGPEAAASLDPATTSRRVRNFSCEICFALVLTAIALASVIGIERHHGNKTASVDARYLTNPALQLPANAR